jgi:outer membrane murein-binding lipoprotein Lpp
MFQPLGTLRPTITLLVTILLLLGLLVLVNLLFARKARMAGEVKKQESVLGLWPAFFKGSGSIQVAVALAAMLLAGAAATFRPQEASAVVRELTASAVEPKPVTVDVQGSSAVTMMATAAEPAGSGAVLIVSDARKATPAVHQLKVSSGKWALWRGDPKTDQLQIVCGKPADPTTPPATAVKIMVISEVTRP